MGNILSPGKTDSALEEAINEIASNYISNPSLNDMKDLSNPDKCQNLVVITSDIMEQYLDNSTIQYLVDKKGIALKNDNYRPDTKSKFLAINKNDLHRLDIQDKTQKRAMCIGLAKHYVQIASIFVAIQATINPIIEAAQEAGPGPGPGPGPELETETIQDLETETMQDLETETGMQSRDIGPIQGVETETMGSRGDDLETMEERETGVVTGLPTETREGVEQGVVIGRPTETSEGVVIGVPIEPNKIGGDGPDKVYKNLCATRVANLINNYETIEKWNAAIAAGEPITIKPKICSANCNSCPTVQLSEEHGIPELEHLYYDKYNYENGKFDEMSDEMKKRYNEDMGTFYLTFTGEKTVPGDIKKIGDIKLRDYFNSDSNECKNEDTIEVSGSVNSMIDYVNNIKQMMADTENYHNRLLGILHKIFIFGKNPLTKEPIILIRQDLTDDKLAGYTKETTEHIVNLYKSCEEHYVKGVNIYKALVLKQKFETTKSRIDNVETKD